MNNPVNMIDSIGTSPSLFRNGSESIFTAVMQEGLRQATNYNYILMCGKASELYYNSIDNNIRTLGKAIEIKMGVGVGYGFGLHIGNVGCELVAKHDAISVWKTWVGPTQLGAESLICTSVSVPGIESSGDIGYQLTFFDGWDDVFYIDPIASADTQITLLSFNVYNVIGVSGSIKLNNEHLPAAIKALYHLIFD